MNSRDELQTLKRGLQALEILNLEGPANVACIARRLEVPRANAHRIVNTLASEGYCRKIPNSHLYIAVRQRRDDASDPCLASLVTSLSIDIVEDLGREIKWPVALAMPHGATMVTRLATHLSTPLALAKIIPGNVASVFEAATGIVFLALASEERRNAMLAEAAAAYPDAYDHWKPHFPRVFAGVREEGYFIMRRTGAEASLGAPIMIDGEPVGGLAMRYIKSATSRTTVVQSFLPRLHEAAEEIGRAVSCALQRRPAPGPYRPEAAASRSWARPAAVA